MIKITLNKGKEQSALRFHPWIFSGAIRSVEGKPADGDIVEVYSNQGQFLGTGHFQNGSITVRLFTFTKQEINSAFWLSKLQAAYNYRKNVGLAESTETNAYRLVFGEADELPGLIIDYYNGHIVLQSHSIGMHLIRNEIVAALKKIYGEKLLTIYDKSKETLPKNYAIGIENSFLYGNTGKTLVKEYGNSFYVDWEKGQKTGFFIDQRENRKLLAEYSKGRTVLNTFCYTGGFSVYAAKAGAKLVHSVDSSKSAIELTKENAELNKMDNHEEFCMDTFDFLKGKENVYDLIVLDPPAFAKSRNVSHNAVIGYKRLNTEAMKQLKSGGILFTFSCSGVIDKNLFFHTITSAAIEARRKVKILHYLSQPADHPINVFHPEGEYLKGLVLFVE
ncbi:MAG: class I SAM-dependent rRNA methyltransferase [Bacteroidia bacterium]